MTAIDAMILEELVQAGLSGQELRRAFAARKMQVPPAVERLMDDASQTMREEASQMPRTKE